MDFAYEKLTIVGTTMEVGTDFHFNCCYFEEISWSNAIQSLYHIEKVAKSPFLFPKGPDIEAVFLSESSMQHNETLIVRAIVSDEDSAGSLPSGEQFLDYVSVYIDDHP